MSVEQRLYYFDSYLTSFEASVVSQVAREDGKMDVRLSQSAFYPTSGGQPHDLGTLNGIAVVDVYVDGEDVVHTIEAPLSSDVVRGEVDWQRRFDHMQQHAGQHILSAAFEQQFDLDTIGFHLGDTWVTIDLDTPSLDVSLLREAERVANEVVFANRPIVARFVDPAEIPSLHLRHAPKVDEDIRIVQIEGYDNNACGGTHPVRTGEVGMIKIVRQEKMRNGTRLTFVCGHRALRDYRDRVEVVSTLTTQLSTTLSELPDVVHRLQAQLVQTRKEGQELFARLAQNEAHALVSSWWQKRKEKLEEKAEYAASDVQEASLVDKHLGKAFVHFFHATFSDASAWKEMCKAVNTSLAAFDPALPSCLLGTVGDRMFIQVEQNGCDWMNAKEVVQTVLAALEGKGGGSAKVAQGSAAATKAHSHEAILQIAVSAIQKMASRV